MNQKEAQQTLWASGLIAHWYLYDYQLDVYEFIRKTRNPFFEATRRFGKTTTLLVKLSEDAQQKENLAIVWAEPWKEQARNIVVPEMQKIASLAHESIKPKFYRTDSFFEFPKTGSRIYLVGACEDRCEGVRGRTANTIVCDELGSFVDADYIINEVLRPLLLTTGGELIEMGTPPGELDHIWYERKAQAISENRFIQRTIDSVDAIPESEKARYIEEMGGRNSVAVRRELYCEPVADLEALVIPEFKENIHVVDDTTPPPFYDAYVGVDLGFNDNSAILFGHFDFMTGSLVIENEWVANGKNSKELSEAAVSIERELWGEAKPYLRVSDNDLQQLYDLSNVFGYYCVPTRKDDKIAAITGLRLRFGSNKIRINRRCKNLIYQLKVGIWNDRKTDYKRGEKTGHLDAIDALVYLNRNVNTTKNPYPQNVGISQFTHHIPEDKPFKKEENQSIINVFQPFDGYTLGD